VTRTALALAVAALLAFAPAVAAGAPSVPVTQPQADLADIEDEVMCPICGTLLELSEAPQAERQREFIRERIARGQTKDEIKTALVAEYGGEVLAVPDDEGFDIVAWLVPGLALLAAAIVILIGLNRWRLGGSGGPGDPPKSPPTAPSADEGRLDRDLARYDL
jgi:cytochrome c-type biogenesis protein CcmH